MVCFSTIEQSSEVLQKIYTNKMYTDITLVAGKDGKKIQAHKVVLTAALEYFELMLSGSFKEATDPEVKIDGINSDILEDVIKFLYLGLIEITDMKTAIELFEVSHLMKIPELQDHAESYMREHVAPSNCLGLIKLARTYELKTLSSISEYCMIKKFGDIIKMDEFKNLCKEEMMHHTPLWNNVIEGNDLAKAIFDWIKFDESHRKLYFKELLQLIDVNLIEEKELILKLHSSCIDSEDTKYIVESIYKPANIMPNPEIVLLVKHFFKSSKKALYFYNFVKSEFVGTSVIREEGTVVGFWEGKIIIICSDGNNRKIKMYDIHKNSETVLGTDCVEDVIFSKIFNDYLYIFSHSLYIKVNLKTGITNRVTSDGVAFESCVFFKNQLFFLVYDPFDISTRWLTTNQDDWKRYASFHNSRTKLGQLVVHDQRIYFFDHDKVFVYNADEDKWTEELHYQFTPLPQLLSIHNKLLVIDNKKIYDYSKGTLKPFDSKLNMLDLESGLKLFSCS